MKRGERILTWHWVDQRRTLRDGNTVAAGYVYSVAGKLKMCSWGLHASRRPLDALNYAPGPIVCRCESWGSVKEWRGDKLVSKHREVLWMADASEVLNAFAKEKRVRVPTSFLLSPTYLALYAARDHTARYGFSSWPSLNARLIEMLMELQ